MQGPPSYRQTASAEGSSDRLSHKTSDPSVRSTVVSCQFSASGFFCGRNGRSLKKPSLHVLERLISQETANPTSHISKSGSSS